MRGLTPRHSVCAWLCAVGMGLGQATAAETGHELLLLDLCIDARCHGVAAVVRIEGRVWIERGALERVGLHELPMDERGIDGRRYLDPGSLPGARARIDLSALRLELDLPPQSRPRQDLAQYTPRASDAVAYPLAAHLNYALGVEPGGQADAFIDAGIGRGPVALRSTAVWDSDSGLRRGLTRVEVDQPDALRRWVLGDQFASSSDSLGGGALLGGLGVERAFEQDPFLNTFPQPFIAGVVDAPGVVEVYANGALIARQPIQPGPFTFEGLGVPAGRSDVQIVLTDPFGGRREIGGLAYYGSSGLLRRGLDEYALRVGLPRDSALGGGYGTRPVLQGNYRRGLSDSVTLGGRIEADERVHNAGVDVGVLTGVGEFGLTLAGSHDEVAGSGRAVALRHAWTARTWSVSSGWRRLQTSYRTISTTGFERLDPLREDAFVSASWSPAGPWSLRGNLGTRRLGARRERNLGLGLAMQLPGSARLLLGAERRLDDTASDTTVLLSLVAALGRSEQASWQPDSLSAGLGWQADSDTLTARAGARRARPSATGWGYDLNLDRAGSATGGFVQAEYQGRHGRYAVQAQRIAGFERYRAQASGALVGIGGRVFATPPLDSGFALVQLPGLQGVPVLREGLEVTRTDARGDALVRGLLPYYPMRLGFDPARVPIGYRFGEDMMRVAVSPGTGALARFEVAPLSALRGELRLGPGREPVQYGELVVHDGNGRERARSALGARGGFWFEDLPAGTYPARVVSGGRTTTCTLELTGPARAGITDAGEVHCQGERDQ